MASKILSSGCFLLFLAVAAGAFGAHALKDTLSPYGTSVYEKAVFYHFIHGLALIILGIQSRASLITHSVALKIAAAFLIGVLLFSGSLYALAITEIKLLGAVTPLGGVAFMLGWIYWGLRSLDFSQ